MRVENVPPGSRLVDSFSFSSGGTAEQARALKASGVDGFIGYLGHMTPARLAAVLEAGLGFMPVTVAGEYKDGSLDEVAQLKALGVPAGVCVWLDVEGPDAWNMDPAKLIGLLSSWCDPIIAGGWIPGLYIGAPQPLTGQELFSLKFKRYWLGQGRCVDRTGKDAYPQCGYVLRQDWHNQGNGMLWRGTGVVVDTNAAQADHFGRLASWVVA